MMHYSPGDKDYVESVVAECGPAYTSEQEEKFGELERLKNERDKLEFKKQTEVLTPEEGEELEQRIQDLTEEIKKHKNGERIEERLEGVSVDGTPEEERIEEAISDLQECFDDPRKIEKKVFGEVAKVYNLRYMTVGLERMTHDHYDRDAEEWKEVDIDPDDAPVPY